jgi:hypothetical protein
MALLSPVYPLALLMPLQLAMKINIVLHYWIGFVGMHVLLTRVIGLTFLPAVIYLATLVTAAGAPAIHLRVGHSVFLPGFYLPLQLYFFFTAFRTGEWKYVLLSAATMALMVFNGGTHILPMSVAALGSFALVASLARRTWRPVAMFAVFGVVAIAYAAPKLLPVAQFVTGEQYWDTRLAIEKPDLVTPEILRQTYLVPTQHVGERLPMQRHGWHEYGNYIGAGAAAALAFGLLWAVLRRSPRDHWFGVSLAATTVLLFLLSLGEFSAYAPAVLSQQLPLFSNFRIPSRYTIVFLQFAALTLAWTFHSIVLRYGLAMWARIAIAIACFGASAHLLIVNQWHFRGVFDQPAFETTFRWMAGPREIATDQLTNAYIAGSPMLRALVEHRAFFHCYESLQLYRAADPDRSLISTQGTVRVSDVDFSPNRVAFNVFGGSEPSKVLLNYNWAPGWSSNAGAIELIGDPGKLATVTIRPGQTGRYEYSFTPPGLYAGTAIFGIAVIASVIAWKQRSDAIFSVRRPQ